MREIKFRYTWKRGTEYITRIFTLSDFEGQNAHAPDELVGLAAEGWQLVARDQFTGVFDAEGVEIYEGDILRFTYWYFDGNEAQTHLIGRVAFLPHFASYGLADVSNKEWLRHIGAGSDERVEASFGAWNFNDDDLEVIGNVHQSPELLGAE